MVHTILHTAKIFGMECVIFLDAIGGTRCIPEKMEGGQKLHNRNGGEACDARALHPGPTGGNKFLWQKLIGVLLKLNLPKKIQKSRIGKIIFL